MTSLNDDIGTRRRRGANEALSVRLRTHAERSAGNFMSFFRLVGTRRSRRPPVYPVLDWGLPVTFCLSLTLISALILDEPLAAYRWKWSPDVLAAANFWTHVGWSGWYIIPSALVLLGVNLSDWSGRRSVRRRLLYAWTSFAMFLMVSIGLSGALASLAKHVIGRARPHHFDQLGAFDFTPFAMQAQFASFPSGHASTVGSVAAVIILFWPRARYVVIPVAIWVASTRVVVGAHYPSDVVAGLAFGFAGAIATAIVFARLGYIFRQNPSGLPVVKSTFRLFR